MGSSLRRRFIHALVAAIAIASARGARAQVNVEALHKDLDKDAITGSVATTITGRAGNTEGLIAGVDGQIVAVSRPDSALLIGKADYTALNGQVQVAKSFVHLRYAREIARDVVWLETFGQLQQDRFQRLQLRMLFGGGPRLRVLRTEQWTAYVGAALMYEHEEIAVAPGAPDATARNDARFSYLAKVLYKTPEPTVLLSSTLYVQPRAGDFGWVRVLSDTAIDIAAGKRFGVRLSCTYRYDSRPPTDVKTYDVEVKNSLTWTF